MYGTTDQLEDLVATLQSAELSLLGSAELTGLLQRCETVSRRLDGAVRGLVAEIDRRGVAGDYGATSTPALLQHLLRVNRYEAGARVRQAREFAPRVALTGELLPPLFAHAGQALDTGEISMSHARIIAKTRSALPGSVDAEHGDAAERFLVEQAKHLDPTGLGYAATRLLDTLNPDGKFTDQADQERRRFLTIRDNADGSGTASGRFTPELMAILRPVLDSLSAPQSADGLPDTRSAGQRRHDGIAEAAMLLMRSGELPDSGGVPVSISVTITAQDLARAEAGESVLVEDGYGTPVQLDTILNLGAELQIGTVTLATSGGILSYGRTRRLASCAQRRALAVRDKGCVFPGCTRHAAWTEVHHIREWINGGTTDLDNLVLLCRYHHRNFAAFGWVVRMSDKDLPEWIPPTWLDEDQKPRRNTAHDRPPLPAFD